MTVWRAIKFWEPPRQFSLSLRQLETMMTQIERVMEILQVVADVECFGNLAGRKMFLDDGIV